MTLRNRLQRLEQARRPRIDPARIAWVRSLSPTELDARLDALDEQLLAGELAELGYPVPATLADQRRVMAEVLETLDRPPPDWQVLLNDVGLWTWDDYRRHTIARYRALTGDGPRPDGLNPSEDHPFDAGTER